MKNNDLEYDSLLIARFQKGDHSAFEKLINQYRHRLYSYLCRMVNDSEAAKDLFQDTIMKVFKSLPKYREQQKFSNWLFSIGHNVAMNFIKKQNRTDEIISKQPFLNADAEFSSIAADDSFSPEKMLNTKELQQTIKLSIEKLPVEQKEVLLLREYSGLPFKEIAELLNCPLNTVLGRMRYALLNLRKLIQSDFGEAADVL
jgi:RNA polymerase sigma factor (sigma-70 family)